MSESYCFTMQQKVVVEVSMNGSKSRAKAMKIAVSVAGTPVSFLVWDKRLLKCDAMQVLHQQRYKAMRRTKLWLLGRESIQFPL